MLGTETTVLLRPARAAVTTRTGGWVASRQVVRRPTGRTVRRCLCGRAGQGAGGCARERHPARRPTCRSGLGQRRGQLVRRGAHRRGLPRVAEPRHLVRLRPGQIITRYGGWRTGRCSAEWGRAVPGFVGLGCALRWPADGERAGGCADRGCAVWWSADRGCAVRGSADREGAVWWSADGRRCVVGRRRSLRPGAEASRLLRQQRPDLLDRNRRICPLRLGWRGQLAVLRLRRLGGRRRCRQAQHLRRVDHLRRGLRWRRCSRCRRSGRRRLGRQRQTWLTRAGGLVVEGGPGRRYHRSRRHRCRRAGNRRCRRYGARSRRRGQRWARGRRYRWGDRDGRRQVGRRGDGRGGRRSGGHRA